jgi:DNA-3-methyladenine glycosylase
VVDVLSSDALTVAPLLVGARISTTISGVTVEIEINEVEAYCGEDDPASHAFKGRTDRNAPMFGPAGTVYVYRSYGIHWCANIVAGKEGIAQAVLLRGGRVTRGSDTAITRRGRSDHVADGPGKLAQALAIDGSMSGTQIGDGILDLQLHSECPIAYVTTPRIGISKATERPWRFIAAIR